jgi:hypothetical protein
MTFIDMPAIGILRQFRLLRHAETRSIRLVLRSPRSGRLEGQGGSMVRDTLLRSAPRHEAEQVEPRANHHQARMLSGDIVGEQADGATQPRVSTHVDSASRIDVPASKAFVFGPDRLAPIHRNAC